MDAKALRCAVCQTPVALHGAAGRRRAALSKTTDAVRRCVPPGNHQPSASNTARGQRPIPWAGVRHVASRSRHVRPTLTAAPPAAPSPPRRRGALAPKPSLLLVVDGLRPQEIVRDSARGVQGAAGRSHRDGLPSPFSMPSPLSIQCDVVTARRNWLQSIWSSVTHVTRLEVAAGVPSPKNELWPEYGGSPVPSSSTARLAVVVGEDHAWGAGRGQRAHASTVRRSSASPPRRRVGTVAGSVVLAYGGERQDRRVR